MMYDIRFGLDCDKSVEGLLGPGKKVLLVDDEPDVLWGLINFLEAEGFTVRIAESAVEALKILPDFLPQIIFLDVKMPGMSGLEALERIRTSYPSIIPFILTAHESIKDAVQAIKSGAYDYFLKPYHTEEIRFSILRAFEERRLKEEVVRLRKKVEEKFDFSSIVTADPRMFDIFDRLRRVAPSELSVLITGENGTGKEIFAQAIHYNSLRKDGPFTPLDCAAIPDTLFESAVFGYEKGAFTGSVAKKKGFFEMAHKGTLFLDEIGNLKPENQVKLLRALQERKIFPIGGKEYINVDIRLISATNIDLDASKDEGAFREDLYFRIKQFHVHIPPLRERPNDIILLARHFLKEEASQRGVADYVKEISQEVAGIFMEYPWPGNVREIKNVIRSASVLADEIIKPEHLTFPLVSNPSNRPSSDVSGLFKGQASAHKCAPVVNGLKDTHRYQQERDTDANGSPAADDIKSEAGKAPRDFSKKWVLEGEGIWPVLNIEPDMTFKDLHQEINSKIERMLIIKALYDSEGNKAKAARAFGVDYKTLHSKIKEFKISHEEIKGEGFPEGIVDISLTGAACQFKEIVKNVRERMEEGLILKSLQYNNWDKAKVARSLGIDYKTLFNKLHKYNLMEKT